MHLYFSSLYFIVIRENRMSSKFVACIGKGGQRDMAESFARRTGTTLLDKPGEELTVLFDAKGVSLIGYGLSYQGDFEGMLHRVSDGRLAHEMLVRAAKTTQTNVKGIDATAGMGEDASPAGCLRLYGQSQLSLSLDDGQQSPYPERHRHPRKYGRIQGIPAQSLP